MTYKLHTPIVRDGGADALVLASNVAAQALKQGGLALHNAQVGEEMLRMPAEVTSISGPSHYPALSFDGPPTTAEQADEVAVKLADAVMAHLGDIDVAHRAEDKTTPRVKTPKPAPGGVPTTFAGADADGGIALVPAKAGVSYTAVPGASLKVQVVGNDIVTTFIAGTTTPIEEAAELAKVTGGLLLSATPTGTGKGVRKDSPKTVLTYGTTTTASRSARLNELKGIINAHEVEPVAHNQQPAGAKGRVTAPDAKDDATSIALAADELVAWQLHLGSAAIEISTEGF